ncbi:glutamine-synthetase adenylyltransferase [Falsirhodobacter sp. alg1]|uniref:[protein-PII] uridylyltransferase family protein n=1 Tax=Falsirhodobacter sp. alg1 TaxID=1472418 RepID=UPI000788DCF6|nr:glutamine-synthetase adenylyltransferase [Falsirhodobacter sp. alg1]
MIKFQPVRLPLIHDARLAAEVRGEWAHLPGQLPDLLANTASCSPYLRDLMRKERDWLPDALADPDAALATELARDGDVAALPSLLRGMKRRVALLTGLADLAGVWPLEKVTGALTDLSDRAIDLCVRHLVQAEMRRGRLPEGPDAGGMVVLAMGKTGAAELNYSSDIDLICLFDDQRYDDPHEARAAFIRVTRRMTAILSDITDEGYVFRTDLRLRPDAAVTPVCLSVSAAESYYESEGRTWERAAFIKARPCAGDLAVGERFLKAISPFVWRRHLDFATIEDTYDMRLRIRDHRALHGPLQVAGHDMKLGRGGIRDIEFFTQTLQLIAGGRDPGLRDRTTVGGVAALADAGWIAADVAAELTCLYRAHREVEHRLQMIGDQQTHKMPVEPEALARVAHLAGQEAEAFCSDVMDRLKRTAAQTETFFAPNETPAEPEISERAQGIVARWPSYPALRSVRARRIFDRLRPQLLARIQEAGDADATLLALDGFMRGLPAGVQIFSLFEANPPLVDLIVEIASVAPDLAAYLSRHSSVLDAVLGGSFFEPLPDVRQLTQSLGAVLDQAGDYEEQLDQTRRWMKERHFRIGVHHLRGLMTADEAGQAYARLARAVVVALWPAVVRNFAQRHGEPPGRGAVVVGMGSLGAGRLHARSDLDLLVIYDEAGIAQSSGGKPLESRIYYARLTQALLTALTVHTAQGNLYEADMRLRPSGRQGPLATSLAAFSQYQRTEAWTWEHLALTRAEVLTGALELCREVEDLRCSILRDCGQDPRAAGDLADMRRRLAEAKPKSGPFDPRDGAGQLKDLELLAEFCALRAGSSARAIPEQLRAGLLNSAEADMAEKAFHFGRTVLMAFNLLGIKPADVSRLAAGGRAFLARETGDMDIPDILAVHAANVDALFDKILAEQGVVSRSLSAE